jgi:Kef-type K+ transport system membrane component KefB
MHYIEPVRHYAQDLPLLAKFAIVLAIVVSVPRLCRRVRVPAVVGMLVCGIIVGPNGLDVFARHATIADFMGELGKLLLMFFSGLEIDLELFNRSRDRTITFGVVTTTVPLVFGSLVGLAFGYPTIPAIVIGSLLASHTLLALSAVTRVGAVRLEPVVITIGATVMSDTLSLIVFAVAVSMFQRGFSPGGLALQLAEIAVFIAILFLVLGPVGRRLLRRFEHDEDVYFILMLAIVAVAGLLADTVNLPGIVGAFLAGLAVNSAARENPAREKLEFLGNNLFIPIFFLTIGFIINPAVFVRTVTDRLPLCLAIIGALLAGKWVAAEAVGRLFHYSATARHTMWALTLPQVAATLAAALVAYQTVNPGGEHLLDRPTLNVVLVLVLVTSILGPVLVDVFAPRLVNEARSVRGRPGGEPPFMSGPSPAPTP